MENNYLRGIPGMVHEDGRTTMHEANIPVELTHEELRVLYLALDNIVKHPDVADRLYAGDKKAISLINGVAGRVRAIHQSAKTWENIRGPG
jgi:hypothetical protein